MYQSKCKSKATILKEGMSENWKKHPLQQQQQQK